ncbi:hypothetical protein CLAIMM_09610 [Cladophialophora immunda]|nr:hypothetical protein CLAIMM_09610 [Cladophialophora immunda]
MDKFNPPTVRRMVQFMYTGDYDVGEDLLLPPEENMSESMNDAVEGGILPEGEPQPQPGGSEDNSRCSPTPSSRKCSTVSSLLAHIRVNSIGDYYGIDALVSLANRKIGNLLQSSTEDEPWLESLPAIIEAAVQSTGDHQVQRLLAGATAGNLSTLLALDRFKNLSVLTDFSISILQSCAQEMVSLTRDLGEVKMLFLKSDEILRDNKAEIVKLKKSLSVLNRTSQCRSCAAEFTCSIDPFEQILRCSRCRRKHYA